MKCEWKSCKLGALITFQRGYDLPKAAMHKGIYPVIGSNGIIGYHNEFTTECPSITVGRSGNVGKPYIWYGKSWSHNTTLYIKQFKDCDPVFIYYFLKTLELKNYAGGSAVPTLNRNHIHSLDVCVPSDIDSQQKIGLFLKMVDDKIELNNKINENLEQQAQEIFKAWFIDYAPWNGNKPNEWIDAPLGTFVEIKRGGSPRPIQDYLSDSGLRWLKISDVTSLTSPYIFEIKEHIKPEGLRKTVFLNAGELVLSNSATPGIPKFLDLDSCIHDGWLYFPKSQLPKYWLYLFFKYFRHKLISLGNGSVFTNLKTDILKGFPVTKADDITLSKFNNLIQPFFELMLNIGRENVRLSALRDSLLPKLMSGEIHASTLII